MRKSTCSGLNGVKCLRPRRERGNLCRECNRIYMRGYMRKIRSDKFVTALDRIKRISEMSRYDDLATTSGEFLSNDKIFLLKAFLVIRDIAAKRSGYNWVDLDKEFEEEMK